jgi:hypothetical protein
VAGHIRHSAVHAVRSIGHARRGEPVRRKRNPPGQAASIASSTLTGRPPEPGQGGVLLPGLQPGVENSTVDGTPLRSILRPATCAGQQHRQEGESCPAPGRRAITPPVPFRDRPIGRTPDSGSGNRGSSPCLGALPSRVRLSVRPLGFHPGKRGSTPLRATLPASPNRQGNGLLIRQVQVRTLLPEPTVHCGQMKLYLRE